MKYIITASEKPPVGGMGGSVHAWERGTHPFSRRALPDAFKYAAPAAPQEEGWIALDWAGNMINFVSDGDEIYV